MADTPQYPTYVDRDAYTITIHFEDGTQIRMNWEDALRVARRLFKESEREGIWLNQQGG